ncbi:MAG: glycoside hydrolase family 2 [Prevotella sp.]|nr:glycoside hydrolase family 2 [Prevotella sp.]
MKKHITAMLIMAACQMGMKAQSADVNTHRQYLSGTGCDDMVQWDFKCTDGRNSGIWTKIGVPSCWELQGFGTYQYGMRFYGKATPEGIADEKGLYKHEFTLPQEWAGRQILLVFEAAFTEIQVQINGRKAGNGTYQGGYTRHTIDVSDRVFFGAKKNRLEVEVLKESTVPQVNLAERRADYWNFGGIWRPVFIISKPSQNIQRVAIDAKGDGRFMADVFLNRALPGSSVSVCITDANGAKVAQSPAFTITSDQTKVDFSTKGIKTWNAEQPNLYTAIFTLKDKQGKTLHIERQKFGFRTIEYRHQYAGDKEDGLFINGKKVIVKGANRHSFRPETGRTLSKAKNIEDVKLIKSMNMNAVRLSHYPADPEFLDACDSLGLYVECELPGWHWAHETIIGSQLVEEMVTRDVNHPGIIFWSNGNEGGFNYELEPFFGKFDPQRRVVLYPWANRNGFETKHYRSWGETAEYMRQKEIFMPTEFLHGLYDGGHGAGLKDYWELMMSNPRCAGGFLWDLMDQGVVRTDMNNIVDCMGNFGSDGIVGPHMEKEGSFYAIREIWSPIQVKMRDEKLEISNCYNFTNLKECLFSYQYLKMPAFGQSTVKTVSQGTLNIGSVEPFASTTIDKPKGSGDVLQITATNPKGEEVYTWAFKSDAIAVSDGAGTDCIQTETTDELSVKAAGKTYTFSKKDGHLKYVSVGGKTITLNNGPRFVAAKRSDRSQDGFYNHDDKEAFQKKTDYTEYADQGAFCGFDFKDGVLTAHYQHGSLNTVTWSFNSNGEVALHADYYFNGVVDLLGIAFDYPETKVKSKQWVGKGPYRVWQNRLEGPQYGYWQTAYNDPIPGESFEYPEFKGYFTDVDWMQIETTEGKIGIINPSDYVGIYPPRDGRDHLLYTLPETGIAFLKAIPAVRNKVNTTDLNGPSAQPYWSKGKGTINAILRFE